MKQWDVYNWDFPGGTHPAVIVSHPVRAANKPLVNVLYCSSQRANRPPEEYEVLLNSADGLDWESHCRCDILYVANRSELRQYRGSVSLERRRQIVRKIFESFGWVLH